MGVYLGDSLPVHSVAAVFCGLKGHSCAHINHKADIGYRDLGIGVGTAGFDLHLNGAAGCKLLAEAAACGGRGVVHQNRPFAYHDGIVKGQRRLCGFSVGDGQCGTILRRVRACTARSSFNLTDDTCCSGIPRILRVTAIAQADVFIG